jgi:hypothetical protein
MTSRHNVSRAQELYSGQAVLAGYQADKVGIEFTPFFRWRPTGVRAATLAGVAAAGATSTPLSGNWGGASGLYLMTFSSGEQKLALLTNGATTCSLYPPFATQTGGNYGALSPLTNAATTAVSVSGTPPVLGVANAYSVSAAVLLGVPAVLVAGFNPDIPRNVVGAWTGTAIVTVTGTDAYGQVQTEVSASGTSLASKKAFATVTSIVPSANITAATFGTGAVLGLPFRVSSGDIFAMTLNDSADAGTLVLPDLTSPATSSTGDVRGTYTAGTALNGAKFLAALIKPTSNQTASGAFGVTPA